MFGKILFIIFALFLSSNGLPLKKRALGWPLSGTGFEEGMKSLTDVFGVEFYPTQVNMITQKQPNQVTAQPVINNPVASVTVSNAIQLSYSSFKQSFLTIQNSIAGLTQLYEKNIPTNKIFADSINMVNKALSTLDQELDRLYQTSQHQTQIVILNTAVTAKPVPVVAQTSLPKVVLPQTTVRKVVVAQTTVRKVVVPQTTVRKLYIPPQTVVQKTNIASTSSGCNSITNKICNIGSGTFSNAVFFGK